MTQRIAWVIVRDLSRISRYKFFVAMRFIWFIIQVGVFGILMSRLVTIENFFYYYIVGVYVSILFSITVFTAYDIIEEAESGFFDYLLSLPIKRWELVLGRSIGSGLTAVVYTLPMCLFVLFLAGTLTLPTLLIAISSSIVFTVGISGLVITVILMIKSTDITDILFGAVNAILVRLSTIFYPIAVMPDFYKPFAISNPISHVSELLRSVIVPEVYWKLASISPGAAIAFLLGFATIAFTVGVLVFERTIQGGGWK